MLGGADNPNGELPSYITGANMNNVELEKWLCYGIEHIQDWSANLVRDL
ncbi:hypothetical protein [Escherichia coli]|nr:hypothetical protein [Escherichia coli]